MSSPGGFLVFELLGVPVRISCEDHALADRLALCYARARRPEGARDGALTASLCRSGALWRIQVEGRDERLEPGPTEAVRALNHELLMSVMLRASELFYVHAAVVERRGCGIVLPGLSRAGKSTLALALLLEGARFLSDELLAFDWTRGVARAFPRAIKIRDECAGYFPELAGRFQGSGEGRFLPFEALSDRKSGPDLLVEEAPVGAVIVPRWSESEAPSLEPITRGEALLALASSSLNFGTHRTRSVDRLAQLVRDARPLALRWREPRAAARAILRELGS